jgi:hypothetical protein
MAMLGFLSLQQHRFRRGIWGRQFIGKNHAHCRKELLSGSEITQIGILGAGQYTMLRAFIRMEHLHQLILTSWVDGCMLPAS